MHGLWRLVEINDSISFSRHIQKNQKDAMLKYIYEHDTSYIFNASRGYTFVSYRLELYG